MRNPRIPKSVFAMPGPSPWIKKLEARITYLFQIVRSRNVSPSCCGSGRRNKWKGVTCVSLTDSPIWVRETYAEQRKRKKNSDLNRSEDSPAAMTMCQGFRLTQMGKGKARLRFGGENTTRAGTRGEREVPKATLQSSQRNTSLGLRSARIAERCTPSHEVRNPAGATRAGRLRRQTGATTDTASNEASAWRRPQSQRRPAACEAQRRSLPLARRLGMRQWEQTSAQRASRSARLRGAGR